MGNLFNNKYRIPSARIRNWDYANEAMYFVTICTKYRQNFFGDIRTDINDNIVKLNPTIIGEIAHHEWFNTLNLRPDMNLELGEFVVMPNHIHGIVMIGPNEFNTIDPDDGRDALTCVSNDDIIANDIIISDDIRDTLQCVSTTNNYPPNNQFGPQSKNLASIIRGYKTAVTTYARKNNIAFDWQPRFYDHIIRNMDSYHAISNYIVSNPSKWVEDKFYLS